MKKNIIKDTEKNYCVACGILNDGIISDIKFFKGNKKDTIDFINSQLEFKTVRYFLKAKIVFKFNYMENDEKNIINWLTIDELSERKMVKLK